jgi:hypothetical protein
VLSVSLFTLSTTPTVWHDAGLGRSGQPLYGTCILCHTVDDVSVEEESMDSCVINRGHGMVRQQPVTVQGAVVSRRKQGLIYVILPDSRPFPSRIACSRKVMLSSHSHLRYETVLLINPGPQMHGLNKGTGNWDCRWRCKASCTFGSHGCSAQAVEDEVIAPCDDTQSSDRPPRGSTRAPPLLLARRAAWLCDSSDHPAKLGSSLRGTRLLDGPYTSPSVCSVQ